MRLVQRRMRLIAERKALEQELSQGISVLFRRQKSHISRYLRKSNLRKRLNRMVVDEATSAEDVAERRVSEFMKGSDEEGWSAWKVGLVAFILSLLKKYFDSLVRIEEDAWVSRGFPPVQIDFQAVVQRIEARTGRSMSYAAESTVKLVEEEVITWYMSDQPFSQLMDQLDKIFGDPRARVVSSDLSGELLGQIAIEIMEDYGWTQWYWDAMGEDPCTAPVIVKNGVAYDGCLALHGKVFNIKDEPPPGASHPNCHCLATPIPRGVTIS